MSLERVLSFCAQFENPTDAYAFERYEESCKEPFPEGLRSIYTACGGTYEGHRFFGYELLGVPKIVREREIWNDVIDRSDDPDAEWHNGITSKSPGRVQPHYWNHGWVPFLLDGGANGFAVDLAPGAKGVVGQVINYGADDDWRAVFADSVDEFLSLLARHIDRGDIYIEKSLANDPGGSPIFYRAPGDLLGTLTPKR